MKKGFLVIVLLVLFIISNNPISYGNNICINEKSVENYYFEKYLYPEYYNCYNASEIINREYLAYNSNFDNFEVKEVDYISESIQPSSGLMDSAWPMYCHDIHHTGHSSYSTVDTWDEIWRFHTLGSASSPVINNDGVIYVGSIDFQAIYPNGTLKWNYDVSGWIESCPAIDENGIIYIGTIYDAANGNHLYAFYSNGTLKWKFFAGDNIFSSPIIDDDGIIYFGKGSGSTVGYINALYPNGTIKWIFQTNHVVYSSPAIGSDGTIYCGSHDTYLYAIYPNNGTLKWKYKTGNWIRVSPSIANDGTIYVVSLDNYLHAVNYNGSLKWKTYMGNAGTSPTIGWDGTIYCGYKKLFAINPINGSVKWTFDVKGTIRGGTPCNSIDGTIYFGTSDGGEIIAVNNDGTLKWRKYIGECESAPAISKDGIIYIGSSNEYLFAFGIGELQVDADGPYYGLINEHVQFKGSLSGGYSPHAYHWNFGDSYSSDEQNPIHIYTNAGNYTVTLTVTDNTSNTSTDTTWAWVQTTNTPPNKPTISGPKKGKPETSYTYTFVTTDIDGTEISYYIDWGDNENTGWKGPYSSGKQISLSHTWDSKGTYTIKCKAKDPYNAESDWAILNVTIPRAKTLNAPLIIRFIEMFPNAFAILKRLIL